MAARKLYGAALAAHQRKLARSGRSSSTALVRRGSSAVVTRTRYVKVAKRRRRRRGGFLAGTGGGTGFVGQLKHELPFVAGAAGYGYITRADTTTAVSIRNTLKLDKLVSAKLGKPLSHGLLGTFIACNLPRGIIRRGIGLLSHAALMRAGDNFGAAAGDTDAFQVMEGDDGDDEFAGAMDADYDEVEGDDQDDGLAGEDGLDEG